MYSDNDYDSQMFLYPVVFLVWMCVTMNRSNGILCGWIFGLVHDDVWFCFTTRWMEWSDSAGAMMMVVVVAIVVSEMNV